MWQRYENETDDELIYRIASQKDMIGSWQDVADILNDLMDTDYTESKFRKQFQYFSKMLEANQSRFSTDSDILAEIREERLALEKAKVQYRDERNEYRKAIREEARKESYADMIKRLLAEHAPRKLGPAKASDAIYGDNDLIIHFTDVHAGINTDNWFNTYNIDVLINRIDQYTAKILEIQERHGSEKAYVILSEVISGLIHENLRCENNENLVEQFLTISDLITDFLYNLSCEFREVNVYVCPGNHSRMSPKKEQNLKGENFDHLLMPFLQARLQNVPNIKCNYNNIEESICMFNVRGNVVMGAHGDKDSPKDVVEKFTMLFRVIPDLVYLGHRHRNGMTTEYNTKIIESGSMSGVDSYALDLRLNTKPEQTVSVIDEDGLICLYDVQL